MSGIAGIWNLDGRPIDPRDLHAMLEGIAHRGPDDSGIWRRGPVGLGHVMLWSTPESLLESLPMQNASGDLVLTADARIDNRRELIDALGMTGATPGELGDSQLILHAYEKWGEECPAQLLGDFAFAIWDAGRQRLFLARDHFGIKPLYFYCSDRLFVFASEIKALLRLSRVPRRLNEARIADYLVGSTEAIDTSCTFYQEIHRFPPAQSMRLERGRRKSQRYWAPEVPEELHCSSDQEYAEAFLEVFRKAVDCRLRGNAGSMLSGGLDSSAIVGMAHKLRLETGGDPLLTFSQVMSDESECDETRSVNATLRELGGLEPHRVTPDQFERFLPDVDRALHHTDDLFDVYLLDTRLMMYSAADQRGVKSLLDGVDGDVVASHGEIYIRRLLAAGAWKTAHAEAVGYSAAYPLDAGVGSPIRIVMRQGRKALVRLPVGKIGRRLLGRYLAFVTRGTLVNRDFAKRVDLAERYEIAARNQFPRRAATLREHHLQTIVAPFVTVAMERYDRVAALFSIEPRHPFFDKRVVELCLALPWNQLVWRGRQKVIVNRSMTGVLPYEVRDCGKVWSGNRRGLQQLWLECNRDILEKSLFDSSGAVREYLDLGTARDLYRCYEAGRFSREDEFRLWYVAALAVWLRCQVAASVTTRTDRAVRRSAW